MQWLNEPASWQRAGDLLKVSVDPGTDFWRETGYGYIHDNGHVYGEVLAGDLDVSVRVRAAFTSPYDQAGIMLRLDEQAWLKTGLEFFEGRARLSTVLTLGRSSWMVTDLPAEVDEVTLRASRRGDAVEVRYSAGGGTSELAALVFLPPDAEALAGIMCAAPEGSGFSVTFQDLRVLGRSWNGQAPAAPGWDAAQDEAAAWADPPVGQAWDPGAAAPWPPAADEGEAAESTVPKLSLSGVLAAPPPPWEGASAGDMPLDAAATGPQFPPAVAAPSSAPGPAAASLDLRSGGAGRADGATQPAAGQPAAGEHAAGQPAAGEHAADQPAVGERAAGRPVGAQTPAAQPGDDQTLPGQPGAAARAGEDPGQPDRAPSAKPAKAAKAAKAAKNGRMRGKAKQAPMPVTPHPEDAADEWISLLTADPADDWAGA